MSAPLVAVNGLTVDYLSPKGTVRAVNKVSFELQPGEILGLAGESGSGKSTLVHAMLRTLGPPGVIRGGQVLLEGRDLLTMSLPELRRLRWRQASMVFQSALQALNPVMRIGDQFADVFATHERVTKTEAARRTDELLERVGLEARWAKRYSHELSGGMRQRVNLALALALKPPLVVMDEPTTALDVVVQKEILQDLLVQRDKGGFAIIFITHDLPLLLEFADRIGVLKGGHLVEIGTSADLAHAPKHPYTAQLMSAFPRLDGPIARADSPSSARKAP